MTRKLLGLLAVAVWALGATGCATKKWVRTTVDPVNQKVGELDKRGAENARAIEQLDEKTAREISRVGEKANTADNHAGEADKKAQEALARGSQAIEKADGARTLAENGLNKTGQLERVVENLENFRVTGNKIVYFAFNKADLTDEAKKVLDEMAKSLANQKRFVIEVQGFTDSIGDADYNYALSRRRADAVVRYLTTQHKVPVYRVHTLGLGKDQPVEGTDPREGRKLSRRVELKLYTPTDTRQVATAP